MNYDQFVVDFGKPIIIFVAILFFLFIASILYRPIFKRFFDMLLSLIALIILSPIVGVLALLVRSKLGSPIIFKQYRPGKDGKIFVIHKFRTMTDERDELGNLLADEARMTSFGKFIRSTSLDELPELWDILRGKMSIVGPRPQLVRDLVFMDSLIQKRHNIKGGLTGLAQVSGRNNLTWEERFYYDLQYVENYSLWLDIVIIFKTIGKVLGRSDVATEGMETSMDYGDHLLHAGIVDKEDYDKMQTLAKDLIKEYKNR